MSNQPLSIPVTIITGFLGSGKTTFINGLMARRPSKRIAIIENEFGEVSIDGELLLGGSESIFEISGGCICCTVSDALIYHLLDLAGADKQLDHLIIETTGIAEPLSIAEPFLSHPLIQQKFRLDSIICMVDCQFVEDQLQEEEVVARQISAADLIILNKTEEIAPDALQTFESNMRQINPFAEVKHNTDAKAEARDLLSLLAHNTERMEIKQQEVVHHHQHLHHKITSYSICFHEPLDYAKFYQWASVLMQFQSGRIYRIKGILNFKGEQNKTIFQGVKSKFVLLPGSPWPEGAEAAQRESKLVFIGRELNKDQLLKQLKRCFAK